MCSFYVKLLSSWVQISMYNDAYVGVSKSIYIYI